MGREADRPRVGELVGGSGLHRHAVALQREDRAHAEDHLAIGVVRHDLAQDECDPRVENLLGARTRRVVVQDLSVPDDMTEGEGRVKNALGGQDGRSRRHLQRSLTITAERK